MQQATFPGSSPIISLGQTPGSPEFLSKPLDDEVILRRLKALRREALDLQHFLVYAREQTGFMSKHCAYITKTRADITALMAEISQYESKNIEQTATPDEELAEVDAFRHLVDLWEQIQTCEPLCFTEEEMAKPLADRRVFDYLDELLRRLIYQVAALTIPSELKEWLDHSRTGYYIPFHEFYADKLPSLEDRVKLLKHLKWAPKLLEGGLVDEYKGYIYRYSYSHKEPSSSQPGKPKLGQRIRRFFRFEGGRGRLFDSLGPYVWLILVFVGCLVLVGAPFVINDEGLPHVHWSTYQKSLFLTGWFAVLAGVMMHIAVGLVKDKQHPPIVALGEIFLLINARAGNIILTLVLALFVYFGYVSTIAINQLTVLNAFLVGYSLDSFLGVFSGQVEKLSKARLDSFSEATL